MKEIWKSVLEYEGLYEASNLGRIRSLKFGKVRILRPQKHRCGYLQVHLWENNKMKTCTVHRLVWETFIGKIPPGMQVNHIDEDKTNNFVFVNPDGSVDLQKSNLNLMTPRQNVNWGTRNQRNAEARINGKLAKRVGQFTLDGVLVKIWPSTRECGRHGFNQRSVSKCCRGLLKSHKGYIWRFI